MIQKKYISPSVEIIRFSLRDGLMLTVSGEVSTEPQLSPGRQDIFSAKDESGDLWSDN